MDRFVFKISLVTTLFKDFFNKHYILIVLSSVLSTGKRRCLMPSFGHLMQKTDSVEKTLMLGKIEGRGEGDDRVWDGWMASPTQWTWVWVNSGSWWWTGRPGVLQSMGSQRVGHDWVTELNWMSFLPCLATSRSLKAWRPGTKLQDNMRKYENWCSRYTLRWIFGFTTSVNGWMVLLLFSRETPKE